MVEERKYQFIYFLVRNGLDIWRIMCDLLCLCNVWCMCDVYFHTWISHAFQTFMEPHLTHLPHSSYPTTSPPTNSHIPLSLSNPMWVLPHPCMSSSIPLRLTTTTLPKNFGLSLEIKTLKIQVSDSVSKLEIWSVNSWSIGFSQISQFLTRQSLNIKYF